jgi:hypothetical protein
VGAQLTVNARKHNKMQAHKDFMPNPPNPDKPEIRNANSDL